MTLDNPSAFVPLDTPHDTALDFDAPISSPVLARLLDEVRGGECESPRGYNRTYNRHNR